MPKQSFPAAFQVATWQESYRKGPNRALRQIIHFVGVRRFGEAQAWGICLVKRVVALSILSIGIPQFGFSQATLHLQDFLRQTIGLNEYPQPQTVEPTRMGVILDSSILIAGERRRDSVWEVLQRVEAVCGTTGAALYAVTVVELTQGIYRAKSDADRERREAFCEELHQAVAP